MAVSGLPKERWIAEGNWVLESAAHLGGTERPDCDMAVLRDHAGKPFIPGTSIAGALRSVLAKHLLTEDEYLCKKDTEEEKQQVKEPDDLKLLFGAREDKGYQSFLIIDDSFVINQSSVSVSLRDGVAVVPTTRTPVDKAKYDFEVLPVGLKFNLRFELIIWDSWNNANNVNPEQLKGLFYDLIQLCEDGKVRLGAKTSRGLGRVRAENVAIRQIQQQAENGTPHPNFLAWLTEVPIDAAASDRDLRSELKAHSRVKGLDELQIRIDLVLHSSLIVRSYTEDPFSPDSTHLFQKHEDGTCDPIVPGTSIAGALRHRAERIVQTLLQKRLTKIPLVEEIFGSPQGTETNHCGSRLIVEESIIHNEEQMIQNRVAIDRLTGGAADKFLFDELPVWSGEEPAGVTITLTLPWPNDEEIGLLLLLARDLCTGDLTLGGESSIGRGVLYGREVNIRWKRPSETRVDWTIRLGNSGWDSRFGWEPQTLEITGNEYDGKSPAEALNSFVKKFNERVKQQEEHGEISDERNTVGTTNSED